jgi:GGDEF domain-containing protein
MYGRDVDDTTELFEKADTALYETKHRGGRGYTFFTE